MIRNPFSRIKQAAVHAVALVFAVSACADDLSALADKGLAAMNAQSWQEALAFNTEAVERFGKNKPIQSHGPRFGVIYYRKGLCELKLKKWKEAMVSFETCYKDFPNPGSGTSNQFNKLALLKWGEAAVGAGDWQLALSRFEKFRNERDKIKDEFPEGIYHVNIAICHYKLGNLPAGNESLEIAIYNKEKFRTPDSVIAAGFQAMARSAIFKHNEQALLDFIEKNRGKIVMTPEALWNSTEVFTGLAAEAVKAEMDRAALALCQLTTSADVRMDDVKAILKSIGPAKAPCDCAAALAKTSLEKELSELEKLSPETTTLTVTAFIHEKHGNVSGAYAAYRQLEIYHSSSTQRENHLYQLVRASSMTNSVEQTRRWAEIFVKDFPDSKHIAAVRRLADSARDQLTTDVAMTPPPRDSSNHFGTGAQKPTDPAPAAPRPIHTKAHRIELDGGVSTVWLVEANKEFIRYHETELASHVVEKRFSESGAVHLCEPVDYTEAMALFQGRKYAEAKAKFVNVKERYQAFILLENNPASLAAFHELECLRKLGDLDGLALALSKFDKGPLTREYQLRQLELYSLWDAVRTENWQQLDQLANQRATIRMTPGQRAQTAYCHGLALEGLKRPNEAMICYQTAMTVDCGATEEIARQSALRIITILSTDSEKKADVEALAKLYEISLSAGTPLPAEIKKFLKPAP